MKRGGKVRGRKYAPYSARSKPWFRLVEASEYLHAFFARLRRLKVIA